MCLVVGLTNTHCPLRLPVHRLINWLRPAAGAVAVNAPRVGNFVFSALNTAGQNAPDVICGVTLAPYLARMNAIVRPNVAAANCRSAFEHYANFHAQTTTPGQQRLHLSQGQLNTFMGLCNNHF